MRLNRIILLFVNHTQVYMKKAIDSFLSTALRFGSYDFYKLSLVASSAGF